MSEAIGSRRLWDWRLFLSLALMTAVMFMVTAGILGQRESAQKTVQITALVAQNRDDTMRFNDNQKHLLADQHTLLVYTQTLAARQSAILAYLERHGVHLPNALLQPIAPPALSSTSSATSSPPDSEPTSPRPKSSPSTAPTTVTPSPKAPSSTQSPSPSPAPLIPGLPIPGIPGLPAPIIPPLPLPPTTLKPSLRLDGHEQ